VVVAIVGGGLDGGIVGNPLDWSREYAGITVSVSALFGSLPAIIGVFSTGIILQWTDNNWSVVFLLSAVISLLSVVIYYIFSKSEPIDFDGTGSTLKDVKEVLSSAEDLSPLLANKEIN